MHTSATLAAMEGGSISIADAPPQKACELRLETFIRCTEYDSARHDDDVDSSRWFMLTKDLSDQPLGPVAIHRRAQLPRDADAQPRDLPLGPYREDRHQTTDTLGPTLVDTFEI